MNRIGLLMVADEDDILERTLEHNAALVDYFYALDGSREGSDSAGICVRHPKCAGYARDAQTRYEGQPRDGWRQHILQMAYRDHGHDNWFVLLHGDELWTSVPHGSETHDGFMFQLPFFFPREGEPWDDSEHPLDQLSWHLSPGYPEFRMFRGGPDVHYDPGQHFNVRPSGLRNVGSCTERIYHYPYRSPNVQRARAARHVHTGFDPDNYAHITDGDAVYWTDEMIDDYRAKPWFADLNSDAVLVG